MTALRAFTFPRSSASLDPMLVTIFNDFFNRYWGQKSLKMSTSCTREPHFHKIGFSDSDIFLETKKMKKGSQNGPNMA